MQELESDVFGNKAIIKKFCAKPKKGRHETVKEELRRVVLKPFGKDRFELAEDYTFTYSDGPLIVDRRIEKGFKTNGADIPRPFWVLYPPNSPEYITAVVIHDFLCLEASGRESYKVADETFKRALESLGVNRFKVLVFFYSCSFYHWLKCFFK